MMNSQCPYLIILIRGKSGKIERWMAFEMRRRLKIRDFFCQMAWQNNGKSLVCQWIGNLPHFRQLNWQKMVVKIAVRHALVDIFLRKLPICHYSTTCISHVGIPDMCPSAVPNIYQSFLASCRVLCQ